MFVPRQISRDYFFCENFRSSVTIGQLPFLGESAFAFHNLYFSGRQCPQGR